MMQTPEQRGRDLAIAELRRPNLGVTQQFLSVHKVVGDESGPLPVGVVTTDTHLDVYFQLVGEHYFLVLSVDCDREGGSVRSCRAEAKCRVYLAVTSNAIPPEEISSALGLTATESWHLGDPFRDGRLTRSFHRWNFDPIGDGPGECDQKLKSLLDQLEHAYSRIGELAARCDVWIQVVYHGYGSQMWSLHWDAETMRRISTLGVDVDVDLYASGPELPS